MFYILLLNRKVKLLLEKKEMFVPFSIEVDGRVRDYYWVPGDANTLTFRYRKYCENPINSI